MHSYKLILSYDGTDFHGWQQQTDALSVAGCLEQSFFRTFNHTAAVMGASRTDAGVHALGQVARVKTSLHLPANRLLTVWNAALPPSITIRSITELNAPFNPLCNVAEKTYFYTLFLRRPLPMVARYGWHYDHIDQVDKEKFARSLQLYRGEHDFASFCKIEDKSICTIRLINQITLRPIPHHNALLITIKGKSFLRFQIRRMVGYALDVARRPSLPLDYLNELLRKPNPEQTLVKADAQGLCLRKILYEPIHI